MKFDLNSMSRADLKKLVTDAESALANLANRERKAAIEAVKKAAQEHGFSLDELTSGAGAKGRGKAKAKNPAKFRNPENAEQSWTGRGRKPQWIKDAEAAGADISDFAI